MRSFLRSLAFSTVLVSVIPYMQDKFWRVRCQGEHFQQQEHGYHTESEFSYSIHLQSFKAIGDQVGFCRDARRTLPGKQPRRGLPGTSSAGCCCRLHLQSTRLDPTRWRETSTMSLLIPGTTMTCALWPTLSTIARLLWPMTWWGFFCGRHQFFSPQQPQPPSMITTYTSTLFDDGGGGGEDQWLPLHWSLRFANFHVINNCENRQERKCFQYCHLRYGIRLFFCRSCITKTYNRKTLFWIYFYRMSLPPRKVSCWLQDQKDLALLPILMR